MSNNNHEPVAKRRVVFNSPEHKRSSGEDVRNNPPIIPSISIDGFSQRELLELADKVRMASALMKDWTPIEKTPRIDPETNKKKRNK